MLRAKPTTEIFRVPLETKDLATGLYYTYQSLVVSRRGAEEWKDDSRVKFVCMQVATALTDKTNRKSGIMLAGTNGIGKTTMSLAVQKVVNSIAERCFKDITGVMMKTGKEIVRAYGTKTYDSIAEYPVLIIDDLGDETTESVSFGNVSTPIVDLVEKRYDEQLYTIITTNLTPDQIQDKYGLRIRDRLKEMMTMVLIPSGSYR